MRSIDAPMIAMSRAAMSSMRSTAPASKVGLSHSTQLRKPCSMASESKGRLAGFIGFLLSGFGADFSDALGVAAGLTRSIGGGFVKRNLPSPSALLGRSGHAPKPD